ncbi:MAG: lipid II flippase Amj family protein [Candidatus Velthaea sp.]
MDALWSWQLLGAMALNAVVQAITIGAYAARIAGVYTGRIAISISLFSLFATASRLANLVYSPLLGTISDHAGAIVTGALGGRHTGMLQPALHQFDTQLRLIVAAGTIGTLIGAVLLPTFMLLFVRGIGSFERHDSLPKAITRVFDPRVMRDIIRSVRLPKPATWKQFKLSHVPPKLLIANTVIYAMYSIGVVASVYASVREPAYARTSVLLSGIVNGIGTVAFTLFVDPTSASIVDQAARGDREIGDVRSMVFFLTATTILGTLVSQILLFPATLLIGAAAHLVVRH